MKHKGFPTLSEEVQPLYYQQRAHMREKDQKAFEQFVLLLEQVMKTGEVGNQFVC